MNYANLMQRLQSAKKEFVKNEKPATMKIGRNNIVLLPGWKAEEPELFWREFGGHFIKQGGKTVAYYPCDEIIYNKPCPVCERLAEVTRACNDDSVNQFVKDARANRQYLVNAIIVNENNNEPVVVSLSKTVFEALIDTIASWGSAVFDPKEPQIICINRQGTGFDTRYSVTITPEKFPLPNGIMSKIRNLDDYVNQSTNSALQKALNSIGSFGAGAASLTAPVQTHAPQIAHTPSYAPQQVQPMAMAQPAQQAPMQYAQPIAQPVAQPVQPVMQQAAAQQAPWEAQAQVATQGKVQQPIPMDSDMDSLLDQLNAL